MKKLKKPPNPPTLKQIRKAVEIVRESVEVEGHIEVDDTPETLERAESMISACEDWRGEGGFYVKTWVWYSL